MAITLAKGSPSKYIGLAGDTKPTFATHNTLPGATYYEYDTGIMYITYDGTNWAEKDTVVRLETSPSIDIGDVTLLAGTAVVGKARLVSADGTEVTDDTAHAIMAKLVDATGEDANMFGDPILNSGTNGKALWEAGWHYGAGSRASSGFVARLTGGLQSAWNDFAHVKVPINNMPIASFISMNWTYWLQNLEVMGINAVFHLHDPADYDKEIEVTQLADWSTLDKSAGFNSHELDLTADHMYYYGTAGTTLTGNTGANYYSWDEYIADATFDSWVIDSISLAWGWHTSDYVFDDALVLQLEINGVNIPLKPSMEQLALSEHYIKNDIPISSGIYTPRRIYVQPVFANYKAGSTVQTDEHGIGHLTRGGYGLVAGTGGGVDLGIGYLAHLEASNNGTDVSSFAFPVNIPVNKIDTLTYLEKCKTASKHQPNISFRLDASRSGAWRHEAGTSTTSMYLVDYHVGDTGSSTAWAIISPLADTTWQLKNWHTRIATPDAGIAADAVSQTFALYKATDIGDYYIKEVVFAYSGETGDWAKIGSLCINGVEYIFDLNPNQKIIHYYVDELNDVIAETCFPQTPFLLKSIDIHLSAALATGELITITKDAGAGVDGYHDTVLFSEDLFIGTRLSCHAVFGEGYEFAADDHLDIALSANSLNRTVGIDVTYEIL